MVLCIHFLDDWDIIQSNVKCGIIFFYFAIKLEDQFSILLYFVQRLNNNIETT